MTGTNSIRGLGGVLDGAIELIHQKRDGLKEALARRRVYRETRDELLALSDRELRDLGIPRSDVRRLAREAAYGC